MNRNMDIVLTAELVAAQHVLRRMRRQVWLLSHLDELNTKQLDELIDLILQRRDMECCRGVLEYARELRGEKGMTRG